jgi:hypothetical protein
MSNNTSSLFSIVKATRASARALADCQRIARAIREIEKSGDTATAVTMYRSLTRAQRRFAKAQEILTLNPLPGDKTTTTFSIYIHVIRENGKFYWELRNAEQQLIADNHHMGTASAFASFDEAYDDAAIVSRHIANSPR